MIDTFAAAFTAVSAGEISGATLANLPGRYIVSLPGGTSVGPDDDAAALEWATWTLWVGLPAGTALGLWRDGDRIDLDISDSHDDLEEALTLAYERRQIAIYDQLEDREIRL